MRTLLATCIIALLVSGCKSTSSYTDKVSSILEKMDKATDPQGKLATINTVTIRGKIRTTSKGSASITLKFKKPNLMRIDLKMKNNDRIVKAYDGKTGWKFSTVSGYQILKDNSLNEIKLQAAYLPPYADFNNIFATIKQTGEATVTGLPCYKIEATPKADYNSQPITMFVDKKSYLLLKSKEIQDFNKQTFPITSIFQNYKDFAGIKMAALLISEVDGNIMEMTIDSVRWNEPIKMSFFDPPEDMN